MSAIDEMEERMRNEAYERGYAEGAKAERERVLDETRKKFGVAFGFSTSAKGNPEDSFIPTLEPSEVSDILDSLREGGEP